MTAGLADLPVLMRASTDRLREGDVLTHYGMVLRLEARTVYPNTRFGSGPGMTHTVYAFDGIVQNMDEVMADGRVPPSALHRYGEDCRTVVRRDVWRVQGSDLATWSIIKRGPMPAPQATEPDPVEPWHLSGDGTP